jgi:hypothetical protein
MAIDLTKTLVSVAEAMAEIEKHVDSELRDISKRGTPEKVKEAHDLSNEAVDIVNRAKEQIVKVHYETKKRQEKKQQ